MTIRFKDIVVIGFALFAMFFGAGNLIFPPYIGVTSGTKWFIGFIAFLFADGGLALLGVVALTRTGGDMKQLFTRAGKFIGIAIGTLMLLCIGPFLAIPRTAAVTLEIGAKPLVGGAVSPVIFAIIFFIVVFVLTIRPSKVVDIVGAFLTPALIICLAVLIIKGIVNPINQPLNRVLVDNVFVSGINDGYQTMDAMAACIFAGVIISSVMQKGYTEKKSMVKATILAGIVAVIGLALVYGGLTYLGSTVSSQFNADVERTELVIFITQAILGEPGKVVLAIIVTLACLTTAIGLTSSCGNYFRDLSHGKIKYEVTVVAVCIFSGVVSVLGVDQIIKVAGPILGMIYPAVVTYIFLGLANDKIKNNNIFRLAIFVALVLGIISVLPDIQVFAKFTGLVEAVKAMKHWPGGSFGFFWIVPVVIAGVIGKFIPCRSCRQHKISAKA